MSIQKPQQAIFSRSSHLKMSAAHTKAGTDTPTSLESSTGSLKEDRQLLNDDAASSSTRLERMHSVEGVTMKDPIERSTRGLPAGAGRARKERVTYYIWFLTGMISISALVPICCACRVGPIQHTDLAVPFVTSRRSTFWP